MKKIENVWREMDTSGSLTDPRTGQRVKPNKGVKRALRWQRRQEACERQAKLISTGEPVFCRHTANTNMGKVAAPLEKF